MEFHQNLQTHSYDCDPAGGYLISIAYCLFFILKEVFQKVNFLKKSENDKNA